MERRRWEGGREGGRHEREWRGGKRRREVGNGGEGRKGRGRREGSLKEKKYTKRGERLTIAMYMLRLKI